MPSTKRKASAKKQQPITQHVLPLLKKPMEQIGKQINVPGSFWDGRMSTDERNTFYKYDSRSTSSCSSRSPRTLRTRPTSSSTSRARYSAGVKIVAGMHPCTPSFAPLQPRSLGSHSPARSRERSFVHLRACSRTPAWTRIIWASSSWWAPTSQSSCRPSRKSRSATIPNFAARAESTTSLRLEHERQTCAALMSVLILM